ncbi:MAG: ATP-binding protein [Alphaproteobacteria bacterium]|nr:ATP-binding protein [Alphaproteobacteria bacterium]
MTDEPHHRGPPETGDVGRRMAQALYNARFVLAAAGLMAVFLSLSGELALWIIWTGFAVLVAAVLLSGRAQAGGNHESRRRQESRAQLEKIVFNTCEALKDPAFILTAGSALKYQNRVAVETFGPMVADGHLSSRLRSPEILQMVDRAIAAGQEATIDYVEKVPSERWYRVRIAPMKEISAITGGSELYLLTLRDQSEAKRIDKMRTDFIANASHELRTPLASLSGFVETLQGPARNDPEARDQFLGIMQEQAGRMTRLLDDLLSLSRLEMKAHIAPTETVDLVPLVGHVCDTLQPLADELGVEIDIVAPQAPVQVSADRDELIQVFENLIENACKYGQSGKRIEVVVEAAHDVETGPQVRVRDYGPGIAEEHVPRLTERFYRVDVEASRSNKGTGLGLAIVKHILTRHRARLIVKSEPGAGAEFAVSFTASADVKSGKLKNIN